jgi:NAD(P)H-hydrate epimerase
VLDADALWALGGELETIASRDGHPTVLTPHEGELATLLGVERDVVTANRLESVQSAAQRANCTVVLKGEDTIVCEPSGEFYVCRSDTAAATAGTGDVLAGTVAALLAKGLSPLLSGMAGAVACGEAARLAAEHFTSSGVVAGDLLTRLPVALYGGDTPAAG